MPEIQFVGPHTQVALSKESVVGDKYNIKCKGEVDITGIVNTEAILVLSNGGSFGTAGISRTSVIDKLKQMQILLHTPNGLKVAPE